MNKDLLFKVSTENLNLMHEALCKIIADMHFDTGHFLYTNKITRLFFS